MFPDAHIARISIIYILQDNNRNYQLVCRKAYRLSIYEELYKKSPLWVQLCMVNAFGWQWKRRRFGGIFPQAYEAAKSREHFTPGQWESYQVEALRKLLIHANESVPYYKAVFSRHGLQSADLKKTDLSNLHKLPVLSKDVLREKGTSTLLSNRLEKGGTLLNSSGSTGSPVQILYSPAMHQRWFGVFEHRVRNWAGVSSFESRGMIGGRKVVPDHKPPFHRYNHFEKQVYFSNYDISNANAQLYVDAMNKYHINYLTGYASGNYLLAKCIQEEGLQAPRLKAVLPSSFKLDAEMRKALEAVYQCKVYDSWGSVEACGLITECEYGKLHINPDVGIIEILDDDMQPVPPGKEGTAYCTGLLNFDQPLIRYRIGDRMVQGNEEVCSCGRSMPFISEVTGRLEDVIISKDGRKMVYFLYIYFGIPAIKQSQLVQESYDLIVLNLVVSKPLSNADENLLTERIQAQLGNTTVQFKYVDAIPLNANGKYRAVVSKIKSHFF